ncbi:hypothetical protein MKW94_028159 [Papaver nudicaule]|uniref:RING-type domain-containing protein n=1 Tax=Papaver nudicaule TaxID=74823 RepID=A0AA41V410_PAPNU|nr:hypothetical protein [Papaver nudicaule]
MANQKNTAIIITVLVLLICIIIIKLIRIIIHRYSTTTTTTSPPLQIIHSPQQIHHHSLRFLFQNHQISPQTPHNQMNQNLINSLPTFKFDSITGIRQSTSSSTATLDCAICITKFDKQDELRLLPNCSHVFHSGCIDQWILLSNHNCPICRSVVMNGGDDDNELKMMISNSSRSFRVEIGSVSLSRRIDDEISISARDLQNRSYSLGSFEYWIQDFDAEVFVELERRNENPAQSDDVSISVDDGGGGMDEAGGGGATEVVLENRSEPDEVESCVRSLSHTLQLSNRFYGGSERRTGGDGGGGMEEGGGGRVWDLEGNQFGGQISEFFGFLSRV